MSWLRGKIEHMFEVLDRAAIAGLSDEALISAVTATTQGEASVAAYRLALIGEVVARQCDDEDDAIAIRSSTGGRGRRPRWQRPAT